MTDDRERCPSCGEPYQPGLIPPGCPARGRGARPLAVDTVAVADSTVDDSLGQALTILWSGQRPPAVEEPTPVESVTGPDGFPEVDDLIDRMLGQYRMGAVIGRGSMGRVYRAEHQGLARPCAVKVIDP